jgi:uncharacterized membrane protein YfcA
VILYTSAQSWSKDKIKATLQGFFLFSGLIVVFFQVVNGLTTANVLRLYGISLPALILGAYIGTVIYGMISEEDYKKMMLVLLFFLGAFMIYRI